MKSPITGLETFGGRLKAERNRLGFSQADFAKIVGASRRAQVNWEANGAFPKADVLAAYGKAGADVHFLITGDRLPTGEPLAGLTVRKALAMLDAADRRRLLLDLLAGELDL